MGGDDNVAVWHGHHVRIRRACQHIGIGLIACDGIARPVAGYEQVDIVICLRYSVVGIDYAVEHDLSLGIEGTIVVRSRVYFQTADIIIEIYPLVGEV